MTLGAFLLCETFATIQLVDFIERHAFLASRAIIILALHHTALNVAEYAVPVLILWNACHQVGIIRVMARSFENKPRRGIYPDAIAIIQAHDAVRLAGSNHPLSLCGHLFTFQTARRRAIPADKAIIAQVETALILRALFAFLEID